MGDYPSMSLADGFLELRAVKNIQLERLSLLIQVNIYSSQRKRHYPKGRNLQSPNIQKDLKMPTGCIEAVQNGKSDALMKVAGRGRTVLYDIPAQDSFN